MHEALNPTGRRPMTINLIGAGGVGTTIFRCIARSGDHVVQDIFGRDPARLAAAIGFIGAGRAVTRLADMRPADLWFITVPDTRITQVAQDLAATMPDHPAIAVHCSGFLPAQALAPLARLGWPVASAHPVMTFADPEASARSFAGTHCGLEGDTAAVAAVTQILESLGARVFTIRPGGKPLYHAAAVFSNNLAVVLQAIAQEAWAEAGVAEGTARALNAALLDSTARNVAALGPAAALTGPAARGDQAVVEQQADAVADWHPEAARAYRSLSLLAQRLKQGGTTLTPTENES